MTTYALYDTDCESPRVQDTLSGPDNFDFEKAQKDYLAKKRKYGFVEYLKRYNGFKDAYVTDVEIYHFEQPVRYRKAKKGTFARNMEDLVDTVLKSRFASMEQDAVNHAKLIELLKKPGGIRFQFDTDMGVPR